MCELKRLLERRPAGPLRRRCSDPARPAWRPPPPPSQSPPAAKRRRSAYSCRESTRADCDEELPTQEVATQPSDLFDLAFQHETATQEVATQPMPPTQEEPEEAATQPMPPMHKASCDNGRGDPDPAAAGAASHISTRPAVEPVVAGRGGAGSAEPLCFAALAPPVPRSRRNSFTELVARGLALRHAAASTRDACEEVTAMATPIADGPTSPTPEEMPVPQLALAACAGEADCAVAAALAPPVAATVPAAVLASATGGPAAAPEAVTPPAAATLPAVQASATVGPAAAPATDGCAKVAAVAAPSMLEDSNTFRTQPDDLLAQKIGAVQDLAHQASQRRDAVVGVLQALRALL